MLDRVLIAGAGIGGLSAGIALKRRGFEVRIYERAPALRPVGVGILLSLNALRSLARIGAFKRVREAGQPIRLLELRSASGIRLSKVSLASVERELGVAALAFHRAELHQALLDVLGERDLILGAEVTGFESRPRNVLVSARGQPNATGEALIGADGLHSHVRRRLLGDSPLRYAGQTSWRGISEGAAIDLAGACEWLGRGHRFGAVRLTGERIYWFAVREQPEGTRDEGDLAQVLLGQFGRWNKRVRSILEAADASTIVRTDIFDRAPIDRWGKGRVTLLGDAAHPMTPNLGQGASQAIEDAVVLADTLAREGDVEDALREYEAARIGRTAQIVEQARKAGEVGQWQSPFAAFVRNAAIWMAPSGVALRRIRQIIDP